MYPENYESPVFLPFNNQVLNEKFEFLPPDRDDEVKSGDLWLVLQSGRVLVDEQSMLLPSVCPEQAGTPLFLLVAGRDMPVVLLSSPPPSHRFQVWSPWIL